MIPEIIPNTEMPDYSRKWHAMAAVGQTVGVAVIGAIWAGRTIFYAGTGTSGGATLAPVDAQIGGLHNAFLTAAVFISIALVLSIRAYFQENRQAGK